MISAILATALIGQSSPNWAVHASGTLLWDREPFVPIGARFAGSVEGVAAASGAGVKDVLVELPASGQSWKPVFDALRANSMRTVVEITSMSPSATGVIVEPEAFRLTGIVGSARIQASLPRAESALIVLSTADGTIQQVRRVSVNPNGLLDETVNTQSTVEQTALVYPLATDSRLPDPWEGMDRLRDDLLANFEQAGPLPELRAVVNPGGFVPRFPDPDLRLVPTSPRFRLELETFLRRKYGNQRRAEQAWAVAAPDFTSFADMARLIPLWSTRRGVGYFWDPVSNRTYRAESRASRAWDDIREVVQTAVRRRFINLTQALQMRLGVPVLQTWSGWNGPYEGNAAGLAGVSVRLEGDSFGALIDGAARAAGTLSRWQNSGWLLANEVSLPPSEDRMLTLRQLIDESASMGMRGWYVRATTSEDWAGLNQLRSETNINWLTSRPSFLNFPDSALNPVMPMRLRPSLWWVPAPLDGNRIDFGRQFGGYRMRSKDGDQTVLWSNRDPIKVKLRMIDPKSVTLRFADGSPVQAKFNRRDIEITLTPTPLIVTGNEIPIPDIAIEETMDEFARLAGAVPGQLQNLIDDIETFRRVSTSLNQDPASAYLGMRLRLERLRRTLAPMVWLEAENSRDQNMSEVQTDPSASGGSALMLLTRLNPLSGFFKASFAVNPRTDGPQDIWLAAKGASNALQSVRLFINNEPAAVTSSPGFLSPYGTGYGWTKLGTTRLPAVPFTLSLHVAAPLPAPIAFDAIVIAPEGYKPNGPFLNWDPPLPAAPPRRRR